MPKWGLPLALVIFAAAVAMLVQLGAARLWDRDEGRNYGCMVEMQARADYVVPFFNGELRTHKPVLLYWCMMAATTVFGVGEFAARFPSALLAIGTAVLTFLMGVRWTGSRLGAWSGCILASSMMFVLAGRAATPDSLLIFCMTAALTVFVWSTDWDSHQSSDWFPRWSGAIAMYAVMGAAVLAKGPVGLVVPTAIIGMYLLIRRLPEREPLSSDAPWWRRVLFLVSTCLRPFAPLHFLRTCWIMRPLTALAMVALVAVPWYAWVGYRTDGEWLRGFFWEHNWERATSSMEGHRGNLLFYPATLLVGFFPWSVLTVPIIWDLVVQWRAKRRWDPAVLFALCWMGVVIGLFSLARTKLPSYVTPCYPALALLAGQFVVRWQAGRQQAPQGWLVTACLVLVLVGIVFATALPLVAQRWLPGDGWLGLIGILPMVAGIGTCAMLRHAQFSRWAPVALGVSALVVVTAMFGIVPGQVARHQQNEELLAMIRASGSEVPVASYGCLEPSWVYYSGHEVRELTHVATPGADVPLTRQHDWERYPQVALDAFFRQHPSAFVFTTHKQWERLGKYRDSLEVVGEVPYFMKKDRLILVRSRAYVASQRRDHQLH